MATRFCTLIRAEFLSTIDRFSKAIKSVNRELMIRSMGVCGSFWRNSYRAKTNVIYSWWFFFLYNFQWSLCAASSIHRYPREVDNEKLNSFTIKQSPSSNTKNDTISSVNNSFNNMNHSHAYAFHHNDDKMGAHSLPFTEPKSKWNFGLQCLNNCKTDSKQKTKLYSVFITYQNWLCFCLFFFQHFRSTIEMSLW